MKLKYFFLIGLWIFLLGCSENGTDKKNANSNSGQEKQDLSIIPLSVWAIGPEPTSITRISNIEAVVRNLNEKLMLENKKIVLQTEYWKGKHEDYKRKFLNAFKVGLAPDILLAGHERIGLLAEKGYILELDSFIDADKTGTFKDFFPSLWRSVTYREKRYGIPQDTESRMIYYRKDILSQMGWSPKEIEDFPRKVERGDVTLDDITHIAKIAQNKKLVSHGIYHRPTLGHNFFHFIFAYGGKIQDEKTGKLVISRNATLKTLQYFHNLVYRDKVMPKEMTALSWSVMDGAIPKGQILFNITGGSWNRAEYIFEQGMSADDFKKNVGFCLIPAFKKGGQPVTLSHPMVYMVNKKTSYPDLVMEILKGVSDSKINLRHALGSSHLAIRQEQLRLPEYQEDHFLVEATRILQYTRFPATHPNYTHYEEFLFKAIAAVEMDGIKPAVALEQLVKNMQRITENNTLILP